MWLYFWLFMTVMAVVIEFITTDMVSLWFAGGGIVAIILSACGLPWFIHIPAFIVVSFLLLLLFRKMVLEKFNKADSKTNADMAIGKEFILLSPIGFNQVGTIKVAGVVWNVDTENEEDEIEQGKKVIVKYIKGNKYIVQEVK